MAILEAANEVFLTRGFEQSSMDDIARAAGTTKRTVYHHFASKEALFECAVEHACDLVLERLRIRPGRSAAETITHFLREFEYIACKPSAIAMQRTVLARAHLMPQLLEPLYRRVILGAEEMLGNFLGEQGFRDPRARAVALINEATGAARWAALYGQPTPVDCIETCVARCLQHRD